MEQLRKLEQVQRTMTLMESGGCSTNHQDSDRFLANLILLLIQPCGELNMETKCSLISEHLPKISVGFLEDVSRSLTEEGGQKNIVQNTFPLSHDTKTDIGHSETDFEDMAMIRLDAMQRANSTLEDFCRSYFMFHGMDVNAPQSIFRYLPMLSFTESYIYQLDTWNEKMLHIPTNGNTVVGGSNVEKNRSGIIKLMEVFQTDPFRPLVLLFEHHGLLTERIREELRCGEEYWDLERKLCCLLLTKNKVSIEDVMRAIHLKSFDYRVLNLLLYQLRGAKVNDLHMEFLSISEFLVEVSDDLFDYEDDVLENNFNILRMFVRIYGASTAQTMLAKCISEAEEKYDHLLKTLDPQLSSKYRRRCEEATKEGGKISGHALGTWSMPPAIVDEDLYRSNVLSSRSTMVPPDRHSLE
ncbi:hypothetical protein VitviT2T_010692 [Vitis vinifera]|uniref:Uncharacterized protein n=2 Tax=Vitis vinifera TaxID=29760 RepID=A0ABY9C8M4_VITVI|nr:uncharacterized protein LOC100853304 isoform X2 [Vitis vinifera]WJZ91638.1 hypothetical protein VitviT2T_010692 [Vitis vinifera]